MLVPLFYYLEVLKDRGYLSNNIDKNVRYDMVKKSLREDLLFS